MSEAAESQEDSPSMEEILQSIRGVISGEEGEEGEGAPAEAAEAEADSADDVLELTEMVEETESEEEKSVLDDIDSALSEPEPEEIVESPPPQPVVEEQPVSTAAFENNSQLINDTTAHSSSQSLHQLVNNIPKSHINSPTIYRETTLEHITIEALKPYLSEWLNENLASLVRDLVEKEIKKLIPKDEDV